MCYEGPHDPADLVEVGPVAVVAGGGLVTEVGEVEGGAMFPFVGELFGEEVLGLSAAAGAPKKKPILFVRSRRWLSALKQKKKKKSSL